MRYILISLISILFIGCSFKTPHGDFIDDMNTFITDYNDYEKDKLTSFRISDEYLIKKSYDKDGNRLYYFNLDSSFLNCPCKYHIVVNKSGIIINWEFDPCDKEKCCQVLG